MSPADLRKRPPAARWTVSLVATVVLTASLLLVGTASPVSAETSDLTVSMDRALTQVGDGVTLTVSGDAVAGFGFGTTLDVRIAGPATLSQVAGLSVDLPVVGDFTVAVDSLPEAARPSPSEIRLPVPTISLPVAPGAYRVTVNVRSDGGLLAAGGTWMGRVTPRTGPLDLAFMWRVELGIHKDAEGRFFDAVLSDACGSGGSLTGLAGLSSRFPEWRFSVGIEPVLLSQLRDLSDGYTRADGSEKGAVVSADDRTAKDAAAVLADLVESARAESVEMAIAPYAGPDLGLLATKGWRDGFAQVQLGKLEMTQTLALGAAPTGAFSPGLDLAGDSVGDYGRASIDHVLVDAGVAESLNEPLDRGAVTVRIHNEDGDRVTLVLADQGLRALMAPPWDAAALFAGIAALLSSGDRDALVLSPQVDYLLPPQTYLDALGEELREASWIRTQTMSDLLGSHPPGTRPLLLTRAPVLPADPVGQATFAAIEEAHAVVDDLAAGADPASLTLESARLSLYLAESRFWTRAGASPEEAGAGMAHAMKAEATAKETLAKVGLDGMADSLIWGTDGEVALSARNDTDSAITVEVELSGQGFAFPKGSVQKVKLEPGGDRIIVPVARISKAGELSARMKVGSTVLGEHTASLRFVTAADVLLWAGIALLAAVVLVVTIVLLTRSRRRRPSRPPQTARSRGRRR